jgi:sorbitol-specific phosphotransferase system component IIBC
LSRYFYSISPAISNGLSFNTETGVISGVPIVASDPVTYVITATSFFTFNEDTATVVIAVGIAFKETEKMTIARSLVSLFFTFRNND